MKTYRLRQDSIEDISKKHYEKLKSWLKENNPFAEKIYKNGDEKVSPVTCSEYTPKLQIDILQIDIKHLIQPVLDIGCGINGHLVNYLKNQGIEVYGIDRFKFSTSNLITADWLEYDYGKEKWGTIISNLGFSNHFNHHNLREDGNYIEYGKTYMNILNSLKVGGCFHYAPDLPFIEKYLDNKQFDLRKYEINEYDFKTTIINKKIGKVRRHNKVHISERGRCGNQRRILASPFMSSRTGTLSEIRSATCTNRWGQ